MASHHGVKFIRKEGNFMRFKVANAHTDNSVLLLGLCVATIDNRPIL